MVSIQDATLGYSEAAWDSRALNADGQCWFCCSPVVLVHFLNCLNTAADTPVRFASRTREGPKKPRGRQGCGGRPGTIRQNCSEQAEFQEPDTRTLGSPGRRRGPGRLGRFERFLAAGGAPRPGSWGMVTAKNPLV